MKTKNYTKNSKMIIEDLCDASIDFEVNKVKNNGVEISVYAFGVYYDVEIKLLTDSENNDYYEVSFNDFEAMNEVNKIVNVLTKSEEFTVAYFTKPYGLLVIHIETSKNGGIY